MNNNNNNNNIKVPKRDRHSDDLKYIKRKKEKSIPFGINLSENFLVSDPSFFFTQGYVATQFQNKNTFSNISMFDSSYNINSKVKIPYNLFDDYELGLTKSNNLQILLKDNDIVKEETTLSTIYSTTTEEINNYFSGHVKYTNKNDLSDLNVSIFNNDNYDGCKLNNISYYNRIGNPWKRSSSGMQELNQKYNLGYKINYGIKLNEKTKIKFNRFYLNDKLNNNYFSSGSWYNEDFSGKSGILEVTTYTSLEDDDEIRNFNKIQLDSKLDEKTNLSLSYNIVKQENIKSDTIFSASNWDDNYYNPITDFTEYGKYRFINNPTRYDPSINIFDADVTKDNYKNESSRLNLKLSKDVTDNNLLNKWSIESSLGRNHTSNEEIKNILDQTKIPELPLVEKRFNAIKNISGKNIDSLVCYIKKEDLMSLDTVSKSLTGDNGEINYDEMFIKAELKGNLTPELEYTANLKNISRSYKLKGKRYNSGEDPSNALDIKLKYDNNIILPYLEFNYSVNNKNDTKINTKYYQSTLDRVDYLSEVTSTNSNTGVTTTIYNTLENGNPIQKYDHVDASINSKFNIGSSEFNYKLNGYIVSSSEKGVSETTEISDLEEEVRTVFNGKDRISGINLSLDTKLPESIIDGEATASVAYQRRNNYEDGDTVPTDQLQIMGKFTLRPIENLEVRSSLVYYDLNDDNDTFYDTNEPQFIINLYGKYSLNDNTDINMQLNKPNYKRDKSTVSPTTVDRELVIASKPIISLGVTHKL